MLVRNHEPKQRKTCAKHKFLYEKWITFGFGRTLISLRLYKVGKSYAMRGFKLRMYSWMVDFVCENNSNKLSDTSKNQICMQSPFVLSTASCETEIIFDVIDLSLDYGSDFISIIPFFGSTNGSGISPKVFFGIDINHTTAF